MFNWFTQILVMEAINTRLTCKLMSVSHQHNKKKMPNKFRIPFQLQTIPALVLKSFINENVEKIVTHRTIWRVFDSGTILCLSFRQWTVIYTDIKESTFKKDLLAHIPRTCFHAAGDESWLTWISIKLSNHRDETILTVTFCSNLLSLYRYR